MLTNIIVAAIFYFFIGLFIFNYFEPENKKRNISYYTFAFLTCFVFVAFFYVAWIGLGMRNARGVEGGFSTDSALYYLQAEELSTANFSGEAFDSLIGDHYHSFVLGTQLYVFGEHPLIPKLFLVLLFSIAVVLWYSIADDIFKDERISRYSAYLLIFCVPLLTHCAVALKELPLFFSISVAVYGFTKFTYGQAKGNSRNSLKLRIGTDTNSSGEINFSQTQLAPKKAVVILSRFDRKARRPSNSLKYACVALAGIAMIFLFRRQLAVVVLFSFLLSTLLVSEIKMSKKVGWALGVSALFFIISLLPAFQTIGAVEVLFEDHVIDLGRRDAPGGPSTARPEGWGGAVRLLLENPGESVPMFIYGWLLMFLHPFFIYFPGEMFSRGELTYAALGYYNAFFALMLPALVYGAWELYMYKKRKNDAVLLALLLLFFFGGLGVIYAGAIHINRYKIAFFWPIVLLWIAYGLRISFKWKRYLPFWGIIFILLGIIYFFFDVTKLVS